MLTQGRAPKKRGEHRLLGQSGAERLTLPPSEARGAATCANTRVRDGCWFWAVGCSEISAGAERSGALRDDGC